MPLMFREDITSSSGSNSWNDIINKPVALLKIGQDYENKPTWNGQPWPNNNEVINNILTYVVYITLQHTNWIEEDGRYIQIINLEQLQENDIVVADIDLTNALTFENEMLLIEQYQKIYRSVSWEGNIKFFAIESLNMNIDIKLLITKND